MTLNGVMTASARYLWESYVFVLKPNVQFSMYSKEYKMLSIGTDLDDLEWPWTP